MTTAEAEIRHVLADPAASDWIRTARYAACQPVAGARTAARH